MGSIMGLMVGIILILAGACALLALILIVMVEENKKYRPLDPIEIEKEEDYWQAERR